MKLKKLHWSYSGMIILATLLVYDFINVFYEGNVLLELPLAIIILFTVRLTWGEIES